MLDIINNFNIYFFDNKIISLFLIILMSFFVGNFVKTRSIYEKVIMENDYKNNIVEALNDINPNIEKEYFILEKLNLNLEHYNKFFSNINLITLLYGVFFSFVGIFFFFFYNSIVDFMLYYIVFSYFSIIVLIDHQTKYLPVDKLNRLMFFGITLSLLNSYFHYSLFVIPLQDSILGLISGYLFLFSINWLCMKFIKIQTIGEGDFILLATLGTFFGFYSVFFGIFMSSILGILYTIIIYKKIERKKEFAYAPSLFLGVIISYFLNYYGVFNLN